MIPLDIFRKNHHNISNKLDAWLMFIASDQPRDIRQLIEAYPEFTELYREVFHFRYHKKELVSMFSEALQEENLRHKEENRRQQEEIKRLRELLAQKE